MLSPRPNLLSLPAFREGLLEVQDEGSQLLGEAVGALPGETVLDLCAGAGREDPAARRGGRSVRNGPRLRPGRRPPLPAAHPGRARRGDRDRPRSGGARPGLLADRVLVDAPCSELGTLRRGPDLRFRIDPASFAALPALQLSILERAARHVRPGGRLVYATCTLPARGERGGGQGLRGARGGLHPQWLSSCASGPTVTAPTGSSPRPGRGRARRPARPPRWCPRST